MDGAPSCTCCKADLSLSLDRSGGYGPSLLHLVVDGAKLTTESAPPYLLFCKTELRIDERRALLAAYRGIDVPSVLSDYSPDNATACCDQRVFRLVASLADEEQETSFETRLLDEDLVEGGDAPDALRALARLAEAFAGVATARGECVELDK